MVRVSLQRPTLKQKIFHKLHKMRGSIVMQHNSVFLMKMLSVYASHAIKAILHFTQIMHIIHCGAVRKTSVMNQSSSIGKEHHHYFYARFLQYYFLMPKRLRTTLLYALPFCLWFEFEVRSIIISHKSMQSIVIAINSINEISVTCSSMFLCFTFKECGTNRG